MSGRGAGAWNLEGEVTTLRFCCDGQRGEGRAPPLRAARPHMRRARPGGRIIRAPSLPRVVRAAPATRRHAAGAGERGRAYGRERF